MPHCFSDEAIVLRSYNIGETDRFFVLLTKSSGRMVARVRSARRLQSRRGRGLLPLHRVAITWETHSFGNVILSTQCLDAHHGAWHDPHTFSCAGQGIELLLKLVEDGVALSDVYDLTEEFLSACAGPHPPIVTELYGLKLLKLLGYLPSSDALPFQDMSDAMKSLIDTLDTRSLSSFSERSLLPEIQRVLHSLLGNQLGVRLVSPAVSRAISSGVTPTCQ